MKIQLTGKSTQPPLYIKIARIAMPPIVIGGTILIIYWVADQLLQMPIPVRFVLFILSFFSAIEGAVGIALAWKIFKTGR